MATDARPFITGLTTKDASANYTSPRLENSHGQLGVPGAPAAVTDAIAANPTGVRVSSTTDDAGLKDAVAPTGQAYSTVQIVGVVPTARTTWLPTDRTERETKTKPDGSTVVVERNLETGQTRVVG